MNFTQEHEQSVKEVWQRARQCYLDDAHTIEEEVMTDSQKQEYFYLDGTKVWMPNYLKSYTKFRQHLIKKSKSI